MLEGALLEGSLTSLSVNAMIVASVIIALATLVSFFVKRKGEHLKILLFLSIAIPSVAATLLMSGSTVYLNMVSDTRGPVHWHSDFELWNCGEKVNILDPTGLENRLGTPLLHEHDDDRVHVEGTVIRIGDISLSRFFSALGGGFDSGELYVPTNDGMLTIRDGDACGSGPGKIQVFVYRVANPESLKNWNYVQEKLEDVDSYVMSPYSVIPPGDCVIIEFDNEKPRTDRICETYRISIEKGEMHGS